ncbi:hypothetical protein AB833_14915 [Chromatiales bacterium (ex Bugula neritina AB1)]|nr:hypothetical protein AB833_14915 [Chromatiales bacterium (ex Bugula neritina AB1)]
MSVITCLVIALMCLILIGRRNVHPILLPATEAETTNTFAHLKENLSNALQAKVDTLRPSLSDLAVSSEND